MMKTNDKTAARTSWKNAILLALAALALFASPGVALADDLLCRNPESTTWTGAVNNDWFNSGNWTNGVPTCSPDVSYYTLINTSPTAQINTGAASACAVTLGTSASDSGNLSVAGSGSSLTTCTGTFVGYQGTGKLTITNGAAVTTNGVANIAWGTGSNGSATVDGTNGNSTWTVDNELDIGGTTNAAGGTGLLKVTNAGTANAASLLHVYGSGTLSVTSGGTVTATSLNVEGTLTGNGAVSTTSGTTIYGILEPSGGRLTISSGNLIFAGTAPLMESNVTPTAQDNVYVSNGAASLAGKLKVTMTGTFTPGTTYTLLYAQNGRNDTFSSVSINYPTCQCFTPVIQYDAHTVNLYLQPAACCQ